MTKRLAMVVFSYYPFDPRVRREAEALVGTGMLVDVISLRRKGQPKRERLGNIFIYRLSIRRRHSSKIYYLWEYSCFFFLAFITLSFLHLRKRYRLIQIHNMPDILVFTALIPRLTGAKVILDLHDPMPEVYMTKYTVSQSHPAIRLIRFLEKWSIRFADAVLTPNIAFRDLFISRGCPPGKIHIVMNSPQENIFNSKSDGTPITGENRFVIMYHGYIAAHNGLDTALEAISRLREKIPNIKLEVYGDGDFIGEFLKRANALQLNSIVNYHGFKPLEAIAESIRLVDLGIIPNKMSPFTNLNLPTRIFEYLSMKKPVIAPRTKGISDYFDDESLLFFEAGNVDSLKDSILDVYQNPLRCKCILEKGIKIYEKHRWDLEKKELIDVVRNLM